MRPVLTQRQNEVFEYIRTHIRVHGRPPTLKEIGVATGIASASGVGKHLAALERKGYLERRAKTARGLRLADADLDPLVAGLGTITLPVLRQSSVTGSGELRYRPAAYFRVDPYLLRKAEQQERCLVGISSDDGMGTVGIRKGDFLILEPVPARRLRNADTVAVQVRQELQARRFERKRGTIRLHPADTRYAQVTFNAGTMHIVGRVIAVMRRL